MEDSRGVIPNEPTQPPNELLHQTTNHISIPYPAPFRLPTQFATQSTPYVISMVRQRLRIWALEDSTSPLPLARLAPKRTRPIDNLNRLLDAVCLTKFQNGTAARLEIVKIIDNDEAARRDFVIQGFQRIHR
jgi:hypothetical protein